MKKVLIGIFLCLVPVFIASLVIGGPTYTNREVLNSAPRHINYKSGDTTWAVKITNSVDSRVFELRHDGSIANYASGQTRFYVDGNGNLSLYDSSGTLDTYIPSSRVVVIDTLAELSTWSGAASGESYFQTEAGKTYIVDCQAIQDDNAKTALTGVSEVQGWSGVSAILPIATATNNRQTVTIMWATTSALAGGSGATTIEVWPSPLSGATRFGEPSVTNQNFTGMVTSGSSVVTVSAIAGSLEIDAYGETGTWMLFYNSAVSAQMIDRDLP